MTGFAAGASTVAEWGKHGHTLIKAGFPQSAVDPRDQPLHEPGPWDLHTEDVSVEMLVRALLFGECCSERRTFEGV